MVLGLVVGALFAAAAAAGIPQYGRSLEIVSMRAAVEDVGIYNTSIHVNSSWIPLANDSHLRADEAVFAAVDEHLGDLIIDSSRFTKSRLHWWGWQGGPLRTDDLASQASFQYIENADDHLTYITGKPPTDNTTIVDGETVIEVSIFHKRATLLQIEVGQVLDTQPVDRGAGVVKARVTGTFEQTDPGEVFWLQIGEVYLAPSIEGREQPLIMLLTRNSMFTVVAEANAGLPASYDWFLFTDGTLLSDMTIAKLESKLAGFTTQLDDTIARPFVITEWNPRIKSMKQRALFGSVPLLLMALLVLACVAFFLTMAAGLLGRKRIAGYMMLRSRGFNIRQQFGVHLLEASIFSLPAALIAPLVSIVVISGIGFLPAYEGITGGSTMPVELAASAWLWSFGAAVGSMFIVTAASSFWDQSTVAASRSSEAHQVIAPWFQRYYVDALLVALSGIVWWEVGARNGVVVSERNGDFAPDLSLLAAPVLIVIATSLVALRLFPIITRVAAGIGLRSTSTALGLGLASVARRPFFHGWPMLALALSISTGIVAGSVVSTLERSTNEQVLYSTGADIHVVTTGTTGQVGRQQLQNVRQVEAIDVATPALRTLSTVGTTSTGPRFILLAVDPIDFQQVAWFRDDFTESETSIDQLVDRLAVRVLPGPIDLPPNTAEISLLAKNEPTTANMQLWIVLKDGVEDTHTINVGEFKDGWFRYSSKISRYPEPIEITSIQTFLQVGPDSAPPTDWFIDDFVATTTDGTEHLLIDFDLPELWTGLPTSEGEDTGFAISVEPPEVSGNIDGDIGLGIASVTLGRGSNQGVRGIYRRAVDRPIPIIANNVFMASTGVGLRRPFMIEIQGGLVRVEVIDTITYFPTLNPEHGPFAIADIDAIIDFIELRGRRDIIPNELFASLKSPELRTDTMDTAEITESVRDVFRLAIIDLRAARINSAFVDPIAVAGWRGMSIVATIVAGIIVLMAYAIFLAAYSLRTKGDSALILAIGASTRDHWIITISELLPAILVGTVVGVGTGFAVSSLMVDSMAHTGTGEQLLPPFILQTNWMLPLVTIAAIFTIVLVGVVNSVRSFHDIQIARMAREGFSAAST
jgi:hypothetical protein